MADFTDVAGGLSRLQNIGTLMNYFELHIHAISSRFQQAHGNVRASEKLIHTTNLLQAL